MNKIVRRTGDWRDALDPGIRPFVEVLVAGGIETYESCEGGPGHAFPEPTVKFHGQPADGFRAFAVAAQHNLPVAKLMRVWSYTDNELTGPTWEMVFWKKATK